MQIQRKKCYRAVVVILLLALFLTSGISASAFSLGSHKITNTITFIPYSGFDPLTYAQMEYSVAKWNAAAGTTLMQISSSRHNNATGYHTDDGKSYIYKEDKGDEYVAQCWSISSNGSVTESDIVINTYHAWCNSAQPGKFDVYSVFLHETGHTAGLLDTYTTSITPNITYYTSVMFHEAKRNSTKRELKQDDIYGIESKY